MPKPRHHHVGGIVTHTSLPAPAAPSCVPLTMPTDCSTSPQRSAAAWAWFERAGSSASITPRKAEGLIAVKRNVNSSSSSRPSRFRQEVLRRTTVVRRRSFVLSEYDDMAAAGYGRRRHSFHDYDGSPPGSTSPSVLQTFSSSGRISTAPKSASFRMHYEAVAKKIQVEDEETRRRDRTWSSLLDESEIEAVFMQLRRHLRTRTEAGSSACSDRTHKRYVYGGQHLTHLDQPLRSSKSRHNHKLISDKQHCENDDDHVLHRLLRLRSKVLGSSRSGSSTIPALCSSISTTDCIIDHHQPLTKQLTGSGNTSTALTPTMKSHLRPQYSKPHYTLDGVERRTTGTQHRHVLHQHVHHIHHHHHHHHLRGASLDTDWKGDVRSLLTPPN